MTAQHRLDHSIRTQADDDPATEVIPRVRSPVAAAAREPHRSRGAGRHDRRTSRCCARRAS
ncbi:hypothetical protein HBB16_19955 [Pseudonocardia sp. MCCB 268]|nr:hypothetical protein [Pseudonocardia cytotoxica]